VLYAIGIGLDADAHLTNEARRALRSSSTVFALTPDAGDLDLLRAVNPSARLIDLCQFYEGRTDRPSVYDAIAEAVVQEANPYSNVALVVYGNPMFLVSAVERLLSLARQKRIPTKVIPGISSFDTVLADLQIDLGYGVVLIDATLLMVSKLKLDPRLPILIFQVANVGSNEVERGAIPIDRLRSLLGVLAATYPPEHECKLVVSRKSIFEDGYVVEGSISNLADKACINLSDRPTLYVPALPIS
jgi:uncharacterized protein YabN with tetrapyrrole methylase and pyrophosphatase domain